MFTISPHLKRADPPEGAFVWMVRWSSIWEQWIGNKRSSIIKGKKNSGRQLRRGEEEFMTRTEQGMETYGETWQLLKGTGVRNMF